MLELPLFEYFAEFYTYIFPKIYRKRALVVVALFMKYKTQTTKIPVSSTFQEKTGENITNTDSSIRAYIFWETLLVC